jgi:hypothetical protein
MTTWLSKIRLWEIALAVFLGFGCYFLWTTSQTDRQIARQAAVILNHADKSLSGIDKSVTQVGTAFTTAATSITQAQKSVDSVSTQLSGVAVGLQKTVALVNAPCVPGPCGTVADVGKTLNTTRLAIGQASIAVNSFDKNQDKFYQQEDQLYADSDGAAKSLNSILTSPDVYGTLHNVDTITTNLGQSTTDFQNKFHDFLYPPPCTGFKCWVKKTYTVVKVASDFTEPAYWGWALATQIKP